MSNLSEEKIIKIIKEYLSKIYREYTKVGAVGIPNEEWYAIQGLLDLYNKEKEKNIPLIIDEKSINAYADEIEDLLSIEDGTPVYFSIGERQAIKIISQYCRNSIPKDKIREKIKELEKAYEDSKDENGESQYYYPNYAIDILEELLEEE